MILRYYNWVPRNVATHELSFLEYLSKNTEILLDYDAHFFRAFEGILSFFRSTLSWLIK